MSPPVERSHGQPRPQPPRPDELPGGVAVPTRQPERRPDGTLTPAGARLLGKRGGEAAAVTKRLAKLLCLIDLSDDHHFAKYSRLAREWRDDHASELAATIGGGVVGPGPAAVIASAALQMAASRYLFDRGAETGDAKLLLDASKLADSSRQNILAAHELAAREAKARPAAAPDWWIEPTPEKGAT